jgi:acetyltransferase-like isoleucine patch superfamily enzyme
MSDPERPLSAKLRRRAELIRWGVNTALSGKAAQVAAAYWGIELGDGCVFYGRPIFRRERSSRIVVSQRSVFRSAAASNAAGLTRRCLIATLAEGAVLEIGRRCGMSATVVAAAERVIIGDDVLCGANVTICDTDWHHPDPRRRNEIGPSAPVVIEDNVWLGLNVVVLKGVTIGRDAVIGAGSVVTKSVPAGMIAAGNPAVIVGPVPSDDA